MNLKTKTEILRTQHSKYSFNIPQGIFQGPCCPKFLRIKGKRPQLVPKQINVYDLAYSQILKTKPSRILFSVD